MKTIISLAIGYLLGSLNPAELIANIKKQDLRKQGTGNLGASNTMLVFGKALGALVMLFDIAKAYVSYKLALRLFPQARLAGLAAGLGAVTGHVYPFYLNFKGGKGLAAFGGMVLAYDPWIFLVLLIFGIILMIIFNYSAVLPMSAGILFPLLAAIRSKDLGVFLLALAASVLIMVKHASNVAKGRSGKDIDIRRFIRENIFHKSHSKL